MLAGWDLKASCRNGEIDPTGDYDDAFNGVFSGSGLLWRTYINGAAERGDRVQQADLEALNCWGL